jgi:hypothetical protein
MKQGVCNRTARFFKLKIIEGATEKLSHSSQAFVLMSKKYFLNITEKSLTINNL